MKELSPAVRRYNFLNFPTLRPLANASFPKLHSSGRITSSIWEPFFDVDFTIKARLEGTEAGRRGDTQQRCARLERFRRYLLNAAAGLDSIYNRP
jgi:hypothetical protein